MKTLKEHQLNLVSGAGELVITQNIAIDGISNTCVNGLILAVDQLNAQAISEEQFETSILSACRISELEIISDRMDATMPIKIELI